MENNSKGKIAAFIDKVGKKRLIICVIAAVVVIAATISLLVAGLVYDAFCSHKWAAATCTSPEICEKCGDKRGTNLEHEWEKADCVNPDTCTLCDETLGQALGHTWVAATCETPKTCSVCSEISGEALGHKWVDANCIAPKTCSVCNKTEGNKSDEHDWLDATCAMAKHCSVCDKTEGKPLKHKWEDANCDTPKQCKNCGKTDGEALGHKWEDATYDAPMTCSVCGKTSGVALVRPPISVELSSDISLPMEFSYIRSNGEIRDTVLITDVKCTYELATFSDDEYEITLYFTGEKIYDMDGPNQGRSTNVSIKVYDEDGYVVADDTFYSPSLCVGEKFRDEECSLWTTKLPKGNYTVHLTNTN